MLIYGTALLGGCLLVGRLAGAWLARQVGVAGDVGGVGIAMLLLVATTALLRRSGRLDAQTTAGIGYWGGIYIPIVVAMAATLDVRAALGGGVAAAVAAGSVVAAAFCLVPVIVRIGGTLPRRGGETA